VLGEGAAAVILESAEHAERRGARVYARVSGYAVRGAGRDRAYSHDDPDLDLDPALRCLRSVVAQAGWQPAEVDVVNANGSSSVLYDRLEGRALCALFGDAVAHKPVHSIKGALGQHGAGSSALQIVASCLGLHHGVVPPTVNHAALDPACGPLRIVVAPTPLPAKRALVHAIGFGGFYYSAAGLAV